MKFNTDDMDRKWTCARLLNNESRINICMEVWLRNLKPEQEGPCFNM